MKKIILTVSAVMMLYTGTHAAQPNTDMDLKEAQTALARGDYETAFASYHVAAQQDKNPLAQFTIGLFHQNGWGRAINPVVACEWFERAAQGNIPTAQYMTGFCHEQGIHRPIDSVKAAHWYQMAAQAGQLHSYCRLGNLIMTESGITEDFTSAFDSCRNAAMQGSISAQIWMGKFYLQGTPAIQNLQEAYRWFLAAAHKQSAEAFYYLGIMKKQGNASHNSEQIRELFEQAAALKYIPAYYQAGKHFYQAQPDPLSGQLSAENLAKAYLWLSAATQLSKNKEEKSAAQKIRQQILAVIPSTWLAELDRKVARHLQAE